MATNKVNNISKKSIKNVNKSTKVYYETPEVLKDKESVNRKKIILPVIILAILILGLLAYLLRDKYLVAVVNNKPIFRSQLNKTLSTTYGKETLENIIIEQLIKEEAQKQSVTITKEEVEKEINKISASLGNGMKLEDVLKFQGVSLADFTKQIETRLQVNKILEKNITITPEEISKYIKDNAKTLVATSEAERKTETEGILKEQKIADSIQQWVTDLLSKAKIQRFLQ